MKWKDENGRCIADCPAFHYEQPKYHAGQTYCCAKGRLQLNAWPHRMDEAYVGMPCFMALLRAAVLEHELPGEPQKNK